MDCIAKINIDSDFVTVIYTRIASTSVEAYRAMLAIPAFARTLTCESIWFARICFGLTVRTIVHPNFGTGVAWKVNGILHRVEGPAVVFDDGITYMWAYRGDPHRASTFRMSNDRYPKKIMTSEPAIRYPGVRAWYTRGNLIKAEGILVRPYLRGTISRPAHPWPGYEENSPAISNFIRGPVTDDVADTIDLDW